MVVVAFLVSTLSSAYATCEGGTAVAGDIASVVSLLSLGAGEVCLPPGDYDLGSGALLLSDGATLRGLPQPGSPVVFTGGGSLQIHVQDGAAMLIGLELDGGGTIPGIVTKQDLTLDEVVLRNHTYDGDGAAVRSVGSGALTLRSIRIEGASCTGRGAGVFGSNGDLEITDSVFTDNTAGDTGGAVFWSGDAISVARSAFRDNTAQVSGGSLVHGAPSPLPSDPPATTKQVTAGAR